MPSLTNLLPIADLRGGRNDADSPASLPDSQVVEALNVDWYRGSMCRRRGGAAALAGTPFATVICSAYRHLPTTDETAAEVWGLDAGFLFRRYSGGAWSNPVPTDVPTASPAEASWASLNGKLFVAHKSAQDRLHVWDGTTLRRAGLKAPSAAPTNVNAAGAVTDTRKYKTAVTVQLGGITIRRSELSPVTAAIALSSQQATMTLAGAPGEGETHWELYAASTSDGYTNYWLIGTVAIGNTIVDNNGTLSAVTGTVAAQTGTYALPWSAKYVLADENRLIIAGAWEQASLASRVGFTSVVASSGVSDDERIPQIIGTQINYLDLDHGDGGGITGLAGPLNGSVYVFKLGQVFKFVRTGVSTAPYIPVTISKTIGAIPHSIALGEDESGAPCIYFLSRVGPYRIGARGLEYLGRNVQTFWQGVNLAATSVIAHSVYYPLLHQWWCFVSTVGNDPDTRLMFDVQRRAWAKHTGESCKARCSAMLPVTFGATQTITLAPHIGYTQAAALWRCDTTDPTDNGTAFQAYVLTKPYAIGQLGRNCLIGRVYLLASAVTGATITLTIIREYGLESRLSTVSLTPTASESRVIRTFEDAAMADAATVQFQIGDGAAVSVGQWMFDAMSAEIAQEEALK